MDDAAAWLAALDRASIIADPRKFRNYVLVPGHPTGKDRISLGTLGFRPRNSVDAWALARLYEERARARVSSGDVDDYRHEGVGQGDIGFILDLYDDGYNVEFSRPDGSTIAWFLVPSESVESAPEAMSMSGRSG